MVDMGMTEDNGVDLINIDRQRISVAFLVFRAALNETALQQHGV